MKTNAKLNSKRKEGMKICLKMDKKEKDPPVLLHISRLEATGESPIDGVMPTFMRIYFER
jgi:hypothetical protein